MTSIDPFASTIAALEQGLGVSDSVVTGTAGVDVLTIERWRTGQVFPQREARERIERIGALLAHLEETFGTLEAIREWMRTESRYLGFIKPVDAARVGRLDRIEAALHALDAGIFI